MLFDSPSGYLLLIISAVFLVPVIVFLWKNWLEAWPNLLGWVVLVGGLLLIYFHFESYGPLALMVGLILVVSGGLAAFYDHSSEIESRLLRALVAKECSNIDQPPMGFANPAPLWLDEDLTEKSSWN